SRKAKRGFTLVELMVALVITAIALLGVYSIFNHAMSVQGRMTSQWNQRDAARTIADHFAHALEQGVNPSEGSAIIAKAASDDDGRVLVCMVYADKGNLTYPPLEARRYRWGFSDSSRAQ